MNPHQLRVARVALLMTALTCVSFIARSSAANDAQQSASMEDIKKLYDDKQYTEVLRETARALALRDEAMRSRGYDRIDLIRLRAESMLRLKQNAPAADAFAAMARELNNSDPARAAVTRAVSTLVKRSKGTAYVPRGDAKGGKPEPIDLLEEGSRKRAIDALYEDQAADVMSRVNALRKGGTLPAIAEASRRLKELADLERASRGSDDETRGRLLKLAEDARQLVAASLRKMDVRVDQISRDANHMYQVAQGNIYRKRGLQSNQREELKGVMTTVERIDGALTEMTEAFGTETDFFQATRADATKVSDHARNVMNEDYTGIYSDR
jgi:hypothetical protein